jgi:hypothetical protein
MIWYVFTHARNRSSLHEIEMLWSLDDLKRAHKVFGTFDELDAKSRAGER